MRLRKPMRWLCLVGLFASLPSAMAIGIAPTIDVSVLVSGGPGAFSYDYAIQNNSSAGIFLFSLIIPDSAATLQFPTGWTTTQLPAFEGTLVDWVSTDPSFDIPPAGTLGGFKIASRLSSGMIAFSAFDENFHEFDGQIAGPTVPPESPNTPEPRTFFLAGTAILALCFGSRLAPKKAIRV